MLENKLRNIIPNNLSVFPKINKNSDPYYFSKWASDRKTHQPILRYWFWNKKRNFKNRKRIFVNEFDKLIRLSLQKGYFDQSDFEKTCPFTMSDGKCGFAVIVAILEYFNLITCIKPGLYSVDNIDKLNELIY